MADSSSEPTRPDLCLVLDAVVASEPPSRSLNGKLCVGVFDHSQERWWSVDLADVDSAHFSETRDMDAECTWLLGEEEARSILSGEALAADANSRVYGDAQVLEAFRRHYLCPQSTVSVRVSAP